MLNSLLSISQIDISGVDKNVANYLARMYFSHRFDLLGSGWVKNAYDSKPLGVEGYKYDMNVCYDLSKIIPLDYLEYAQKVAARIDADYEPIDWQRDYKSGYRWDQTKACNLQKFGHELGVDIKMPWELARMHHLPRLAVISLVNSELKEKAIKEFKNQVLDFIATNPTAMGANWTCPMDVGIRAANMLVAYDLFNQMDEQTVLDDEFKRIFTDTLYRQGRHLRNNLEIHEVVGTGNHYLSDILGILFISAYLPCGGEVNDWLGFSVHEIISEMPKQFNEDGGNFECTTMYHRLAGELMTYSVALILGLTGEKIKALETYQLTEQQTAKVQEFKDNYTITGNHVQFSQHFIDKLFRMGMYTIHMTKPTGEIPQISDGDSGRVFILSPNGSFMTNIEAEKKYFNLTGYNKHIKSYASKDELYWDESSLDCSTFIAAIGGVFGDECFKNDKKIEASFVRGLSKNRTLSAENTELLKPKICQPVLEQMPYVKEITIKPERSLDKPLTHNLQMLSYPDTGVYILKSDRIHLTISAGPIGQNGYGGHGHNDKLSFELNIDGEDIVVDAGTYLYTPLYNRRAEFRSVKTHNTLVVDDVEQNDWKEGLEGAFHLISHSKVDVLKCNKDEFEAILTYKGICQTRLFKIYADKITITDRSNKEFRQNFARIYSNGYGRLLNAEPNCKVKNFEFRSY